MGQPQVMGQLGSWPRRPDWRIVGLWLVVLFGVGVRFYGLDSKIYWHDEAHTSMRIFGHSLRDFIAEVYVGQPVSVESVQRYQRPDPALGFEDTWQMLTSRPEHSPVYYLLAHFWAREFADPRVGARMVSAFAGILMLPLLYLLGRDLFGERDVGAFALAVAAVSPFQLLYAQEARQYALWGAVTVLASLVLVRATRDPQPWRWGLYGLTVALGLYTHLLFASVVLAHGIYVAYLSRRGSSGLAKPFGLAVLGALVAFIPWVYLLLSQADQVQKVTAWMSLQRSFVALGWSWLSELGRLFLDTPGDRPWWLLGTTAAAGLVYFFVRRAPAGPKWFLLSMILASAALVILPDLLSGGRRSQNPRYLMPVWIGVQFCAAYTLAALVRSPRPGERRLGQAATVVVLVAGILSCIAIVRADTWWNKGASALNADAARIINASAHPLVASANGAIGPGEVLSLSYLLEPKVGFLLVDYGRAPLFPEGYSDVFLFNPSCELVEALAGPAGVIRVLPKARLWRLPKPGEATAAGEGPCSRSATSGRESSR